MPITPEQKQANKLAKQQAKAEQALANSQTKGLDTEYQLSELIKLESIDYVNDNNNNQTLYTNLIKKCVKSKLLSGDAIMSLKDILSLKILNDNIIIESSLELPKNYSLVFNLDKDKINEGQSGFFKVTIQNTLTYGDKEPVITSYPRMAKIKESTDNKSIYIELFNMSKVKSEDLSNKEKFKDITSALISKA